MLCMEMISVCLLELAMYQYSKVPHVCTLGYDSWPCSWNRKFSWLIAHGHAVCSLLL